MRLQNKIALITGAATGDKDGLKGIGGAAVWAFIREGAKVVVTDVNDSLGEKTVSQINQEGGEALYLHLDVTSETDWKNAIGAAVSRFGRLDILVNNAGYGSIDERALIENTTVEAWDDSLAVNGRGTFLGIKHAIPEMRKIGGGSIVNISSIDGIIGETISTVVDFSLAPYQAGKGAIRILTKAAAIELAKDNIRVNSIHPGYTDTPKGRITPSFNDLLKDHLISKIPLGRRALAEEIANGILFLASDESSYMTGAELVIDGGVTAV